MTFEVQTIFAATTCNLLSDAKANISTAEPVPHKDHREAMTTSPSLYPFSDLRLSRRLERAEGLSNAAIVDGRAEIEPDIDALWIEVAGAYAMFDGIGSPLTQTFALGLFDRVGE